ncbi:oleate hydratase [Aspergillus pseudotamarii]|uniref:Oleate hydratase n=1 Tax=Aspergillus pseudotamarii TaxID=132259 RepID=A0A5N6SBL8_ASPPS|nr:oleate hydratase [Aspergillus pseudotamarii]KAE8130793.1 oleate hydratase [Aspergillus pseudotamarii]
MPHKESSNRRDPGNVQAWLIGGGIASLAAAVHLINDAKVPGKNVHLLDEHRRAGGAMQSSGDAENGYVLRTACLPYFHDICVQDLLSYVPSPGNNGRSIMDVVRDSESGEGVKKPIASTRLVEQRSEGLESVDDKQFHLGIKHRWDLIKLMVEGEKAVAGKAIKDLFDESFFNSKFWTLWSTTFALRPEHGAVEFQRHLRKYLEKIKDINNVSALDRTQYTLYDSVILPIIAYLEKEGVDFRFNAKVTELVMYPEGDPTTVSEIKLVHDDNNPSLVTIDPMDIVIVTLGSVSSGSVVGSNHAPPTSEASVEDTIMEDWSLWNKVSTLATRKFGDPVPFRSHIKESTVETFTITLKDPLFLDTYEKWTHNQAGSAALVSFVHSNWNLSLSVPCQPLFANQPASVHVVWGYGMELEKPGNIVKKPMKECSGEEILIELLGHLGLDQERVLPYANTIPCIFPMATASLLKRAHFDRPEVIPHNTTNMAFVGQFVEIPHDTTFSMEYSVRSAQMAVYNLMGLSKRPPPVKTNVLLEVFGLLA